MKLKLVSRDYPETVEQLDIEIKGEKFKMLSLDRIKQSNVFGGGENAKSEKGENGTV